MQMMEHRTISLYRKMQVNIEQVAAAPGRAAGAGADFEEEMKVAKEEQREIQAELQKHQEILKGQASDQEEVRAFLLRDVVEFQMPPSQSNITNNNIGNNNNNNNDMTFNG
mmetsp:Transcript_26133/g.65328  ORF Transcript_26133/g.65328 Transcript_26133/m.65328 type:complete len:111 (-) Transcript_26133:147-479(-)